MGRWKHFKTCSGISRLKLSPSCLIVISLSSAKAGTDNNSNAKNLIILTTSTTTALTTLTFTMHIQLCTP